jgi:uncharacterized protein YbjQ (UPF0145 family)
METQPTLLTIEAMPSDCQKIIGMVNASCCLSKSLIGDVAANMKNWTVGGELDMYSQLIDNATEIVKERLIEVSKQKKAKAVIGVIMSTTQVIEGAA